MNRWKWKLWFALILVLIVSILMRLQGETALYFGDVLTNPFQAKGDFYDPEKGHTGIDIGTPEGSPLTISVPMRVVDVREQHEMGNVLYTKDAWGNVLVFAHLSEIRVNLGEIVKAGQVFALTGNTGVATRGPHLHFEIISAEPALDYEIMTRRLGNYTGYNIDPVAYLEALPE